MKNTTAIGSQAEDLAAQYLISQGYKILQRNFKNRFSELDIIAKNTEYICCVEVKYRNTDDYGGGLGAISADKKKRLARGFEYWLYENPQYAKLQPRIDVIAVGGNEQIQFIENAIE